MEVEKLSNKNKIIEYIIIFIVIVDILLLLSLALFNLPLDVQLAIIYVDLLVCVVLFSDFCFRMYYSDNKKEFIKENWVDLIAAIPLDFFVLRGFRFIRFFKIFKILRLARIGILINRNFKYFFKFLKITYLDKLIALILGIILVSAIILFEVDSSFGTFFNAFWYVIVTITTVGYGDFTPSTVVGKIIGIIIILLGIAFFSIMTAAIASSFIEKFESENLDNDHNYQKLLEIQDELKLTNQKINSLEKEIIELKNK